MLNIGEEVEAKTVNVDKKNRAITLSIKAKEFAEEAEALQDYSRKSSAGTTTLGDILKEQMEKDEINCRERKKKKQYFFLLVLSQVFAVHQGALRISDE